MKLSDKILLGFFGSIFLYMTMAFIEVRVRGDYNRISLDNAKAEEVKINGPVYIVSSGLGKRISLKSDKNSRIEVLSLSGDLLEDLDYIEKGDSLILNSFDIPNDANCRLNIYVDGDRLKFVSADESNITFSDLKFDSLKIELTGGRIGLDDGFEARYMAIIAKQEAQLYANDVSLFDVNLDVDDSEVQLRSSINLLKGSIVNGSRLIVKSVNQFDLKKDDSSKLNHTN